MTVPLSHFSSDTPSPSLPRHTPTLPHTAVPQSDPHKPPSLSPTLTTLTPTLRPSASLVPFVPQSDPHKPPAPATLLLLLVTAAVRVSGTVGIFGTLSPASRSLIRTGVILDFRFHHLLQLQSLRILDFRF